jgi:hypothetical protein
MKKLYFLYYFLIFNFFLINYVVGQDVLFKVTRIKSKGDYFIIIAERNDSLFKIISKKVSLINPNLELLKKGHYYSFAFGDPNIELPKENVEPLSGIMTDLDIKNNPFFIDGNTKIRFTKRFHYRLYLSKNLKGLYYSP